jgi:hypothetical protein
VVLRVEKHILASNVQLDERLDELAEIERRLGFSFGGRARYVISGLHRLLPRGQGIASGSVPSEVFYRAFTLKL